MLDLKTHRLCDCSPKSISCISAKDWAKAQVVVWKFSYNKDDIRDKNSHPAVFPLSLASKVIELFTHRGELVVDPFVGSGTTLVSAQRMERNAIGFDLQEKYALLANGRLGPRSPWHPHLIQTAINEDSRRAAEYIPPESVKLVLTSPPYANMLSVRKKNKSRNSKNRDNGQLGVVQQYSSDPRDLGNLSIDSYYESMADIFRGLYPLVLKGGSLRRQRRRPVR